MAYELHMAKERLKENGVVPATESELNKLATAQVYFTRIENESENREALLRCQPMARAIFGEEVERAMDTLLQQFRMLQVSASSQLHFSNETEPAFRKNIEANLWEGAYDDDDKSMTKTIAAQITTIEKICLPVVRLSGQK
ncbi:MAG: hypothetical protein CMH13_18695 [Martelella sp.]|nr:hypothetical protein [Martelella sp.]|tara:strand:- start:2048 stop:2470 length:423 start_codon:yes stop_codon:yes gene_type:complete